MGIPTPPIQPPATPLKYSDIAKGAAVFLGAVFTSLELVSSFQTAHPELVGVFTGIVTGLTGLGLWLASKGD